MLAHSQTRWLDQRLRVLLLALVALALVVVPLLTAGVAAAAEHTGSATSSTPVAGEADEALAGAITEDGRVELLYFGTETCPFCQQMEGYLADLEASLGAALEIVTHEVAEPAAQARWQSELEARGHTASGVPTTILGDRVWVGFNEQVAAEITRAVEDVAASEAVAGSAAEESGSAAEAGGESGSAAEAGGDAAAELTDPAEVRDTTINLPVFGEVDLAGRSAVGVTALIAFVDGFNPCSLWVLAVLLAMVLNAGASRARIMAVGVTFLTVTGLIYGAFIVGVFTVVGLLANIAVIGWVVGAIALLFGVVNIKDYFAYKQGLSFTIPDRFKPRIYRGGRAIRDEQRPLPAVLVTTVVLAAGVAVIELPCTMGFPVVWTGTLQTMGITQGTTFASLLALYLLIYVGLELVLFSAVVATMRITRFEERHGRWLKLIGGSLMVVLGVAMVWFRQLLDSLTGLLWLTLAAIGLTAALAGINRVLVRNRDRIGSDR